MRQNERLAVGWSDDHFDFAFEPEPGRYDAAARGVDLSSLWGRGRGARDEDATAADADDGDPPGLTSSGVVSISLPSPATGAPVDDSDPEDAAALVPHEDAAPATVETPGAGSPDDGRGGPAHPEVIDEDSGTPPPPVLPPDTPPEPTEQGRGSETPGTPVPTPADPPPGPDPAEYGRTDGVPPDPPDTPVTQYTSGQADESSYNVQIDFAGTWTVALQAAFIDAADWLSEIILADLPDAVWEGNQIDDIEIGATLQPIDGAGGILGSAGPTVIRTDSFLPALGEMTFDSADADALLDTGGWAAVVLHEMMHALGFGTMWTDMALTTGSIQAGNMRFVGINATDTYQSEFPGIAAGDPFPASGVPVETDGGPGTAGGHWDEVLFGTELMTGFLDDGTYTSLMTIAALEDMGYDTVFDDPYVGTDLYGPVPADPLIFA